VAPLSLEKLCHRGGGAEWHNLELLGNARMSPKTFFFVHHLYKGYSRWAENNTQ
jgi:hypothetical protein